MMRRIQTTQRTVEQKTILTWKRYVDRNHLKMNFNLKIFIPEIKFVFRLKKNEKKEKIEGI